jgi:CPA1 family monovalent cation:H+ antiporter
MNDLELVIALLAIVALLAELASLLRIPYPIVLVVGGLGIGLVPGLPDVEVDPDLILLAFLPPLLQAAAWGASPQALRQFLQPIVSLAVGLVVATVLGVALLAHEVIGLPWGASFVLGAILSPTDPVAAEAIFRRLGVRESLRTVVGGEALVNDGIALVIYQLAIAVAIGETVSVPDAAGQFLLVGGGGLLFGVAAAKLVLPLWRRLREPAALIVATVVTPYLIYIGAQEAGLSGILAVVTSGLYFGWHEGSLTTASVRLQMHSFWEVLIFMLNAGVFVLVGLSVSNVLASLESRSTGELAGYALAAIATVISIRVLWFNTVPYARVRMARMFHVDQEVPPWKERLVASWSGMRGAVALALALAVPLEADGSAFPGRDLILFVTYAVILATIVLPGLTLGPLIQRLGLDTDDEAARQELEARIAAARAALAHFDSMCKEQSVPRAAQERLRDVYEQRVERFKERLEADEPESQAEAGERSAAWRAWRRELIGAERKELKDLRDRGELSVDAMRRIERDLDLEEARWT